MHAAHLINAGIYIFFRVNSYPTILTVFFWKIQIFPVFNEESLLKFAEIYNALKCWRVINHIPISNPVLRIIAIATLMFTETMKVEKDGKISGLIDNSLQVSFDKIQEIQSNSFHLESFILFL